MITTFLFCLFDIWSNGITTYKRTIQLTNSFYLNLSHFYIFCSFAMQKTFWIRLKRKKTIWTGNFVGRWYKNESFDNDERQLKQQQHTHTENGNDENSIIVLSFVATSLVYFPISSLNWNEIKHIFIFITNKCEKIAKQMLKMLKFWYKMNHANN